LRSRGGDYEDLLDDLNQKECDTIWVNMCYVEPKARVEQLLDELRAKECRGPRPASS
jgi:hypothetical protein